MVLAVVLAAGAGSRFAGDVHKLLAPLRGRPLVAHAIDAAVASGLEVALVVGVGTVADEIAALAPPGVAVLANPHAAEGQVVSARAGIAAADAWGHDAVVVGLGDQPFVRAEAWRAVAAAHDPLAFATYDGHRGHPVRLARPVWNLLPVAGDAVARDLAAARPDLVGEIRCDAGDATDIDTLEDLHRWS